MQINPDTVYNILYQSTLYNLPIHSYISAVAAGVQIHPDTVYIILYQSILYNLPIHSYISAVAAGVQINSDTVYEEIEPHSLPCKYLNKVLCSVTDR